jgi:DNA mismatch repair ATPase MutS
MKRSKIFDLIEQSLNSMKDEKLRDNSLANKKLNDLLGESYRKLESCQSELNGLKIEVNHKDHDIYSLMNWKESINQFCNL